ANSQPLLRRPPTQRRRSSSPRCSTKTIFSNAVLNGRRRPSATRWRLNDTSILASKYKHPIIPLIGLSDPIAFVNDLGPAYKTYLPTPLTRTVQQLF
ncbi:hypothetical protein COCHEDRAFT_1176546, partial [Bipolaris maydis C5]